MVTVTELGALLLPPLLSSIFCSLFKFWPVFVVGCRRRVSLDVVCIPHPTHPPCFTVLKRAALCSFFGRAICSLLLCFPPFQVAAYLGVNHRFFTKRNNYPPSQSSLYLGTALLSFVRSPPKNVHKIYLTTHAHVVALFHCLIPLPSSQQRAKATVAVVGPTARKRQNGPCPGPGRNPLLFGAPIHPRVPKADGLERNFLLFPESPPPKLA
jgi:hypothetical protein